MDPNVKPAKLSSPSWDATPAPTEVVTAAEPVKKPGFNFNPKILVILIGIALVGGLVLLGMNFLKPKPSSQPGGEQPAAVSSNKPEAAFNLFIASPNVEVGSKVKVSVLVKSDKDAANLFVAKLKFPADLLEVESIDLKPKNDTGAESGFIKDWFINNWVEQNYDNNAGTISLVGGVPTPGFKTETGGSGALMADVYFLAKKAGDATISFENTSAIYRDSDNTNTLTTKREVSLKITGEASTVSEDIKGDINQDGKLNLVDMSVLLSKWGFISGLAERADLVIDGQVNSFDYGSLMQILKEKGVLEGTLPSSGSELSNSGTKAP